jgi:hypothetical protein
MSWYLKYEVTLVSLVQSVIDLELGLPRKVHLLHNSILDLLPALMQVVLPAMDTNRMNELEVECMNNDLEIRTRLLHCHNRGNEQ